MVRGELLVSSYLLHYLESYDYKSLNISLLDAFHIMALGDKLFEESGNITWLKITRVHPFEGASFTSEIRGEVAFQAAKIWAQVS